MTSKGSFGICFLCPLMNLYSQSYIATLVLHARNTFFYVRGLEASNIASRGSYWATSNIVCILSLNKASQSNSSESLTCDSSNASK